MAERPLYIPMPPRPPTAGSGSGTPPSGLSSPRVAPLTGDVAPAMSPLDLFAAQSRALARQLEDSCANGRRVSRLPPLAVADGLAKKPAVVRNPFDEQPGPAPASASAPRGPATQLDREMSDPTANSSAGGRLEIEDPQVRPKSFYPRLSSIPVSEAESPLFDSPVQQKGEQFFTPVERPAAADYFGPLRPQTRSPEHFSRPRTSADRQRGPPAASAHSKASFDSVSRPPHGGSGALERGGSVESSSSRVSTFSAAARSLQPPNPPYARKTPSLRSLDSDDDCPGITPASSAAVSQGGRKFSGSSSGFSAPQSPQSAFAPPPAQHHYIPYSPHHSQHQHQHNRSPSQSSDYSLGGTRLVGAPRAGAFNFNFSRPMSRGLGPADAPSPSLSTPGLPTPDPQPRIVGEEELPGTPEMPALEADATKAPADAATPASYIYSKYSLPRGRMVQRDSLPFESLMPQFEWEQSHIGPPADEAEPPLVATPGSTAGSSYLATPDLGGAPGRVSTESAPAATGLPALLALPDRSALPRTSTESAPMPGPPPPPGPAEAGGPELQHRHSMTSMATMNSGSTIKASQQQQQAHRRQAQQHPPNHSTTQQQQQSQQQPSSSPTGADDPAARALPPDATAEEHLAKGIALHERGALSESTYHLRRAARQHHPTAMLLYALACRHGWGMRPSPAEAVAWLKRAMDCASIELTHGAGLPADATDGGSPEVEARDHPSGGRTAAEGAAASTANPAAERARKAQFALSVYELGVSHMNGWGVERDRGLALRCFEIAASWGDADAMAEAGFCYAQAVGCRKDLRKAARYYRSAEARGMSMVGNSWIYKAKYDEKDADERGRGTAKASPGGGAEKKPRDKSRTRTLFGRKKSVAAA